MKKNQKNPIDEYGQGNCCPVCKSTKITVHFQFPLYVDIDLNTDKEILYNHKGKRIYKPSNQLLAALYSAHQTDAQMWIFNCRNCNWQSRTFTQ